MSLTEADFMAALHGYISNVTGMDGNRIFRGTQSRMVLPKTGPYCIYTPIIRNRRGTNVYHFDASWCDDDTNGIDTMTALVLIDVQTDFYMDDAAKNAQALEIASRSYYGTDYFTAEGVDVRVVTANSPKNLTGIDAADQYAERWSVTITAEINSEFGNDLPWMEDFTFKAIKNVDVYFPPTD